MHNDFKENILYIHVSRRSDIYEIDYEKIITTLQQNRSRKTSKLYRPFVYIYLIILFDRN